MSESASAVPHYCPLSPLRSLGDVAKRLFDILAAVFGLSILSPVFLYIAWRIKRDTPGPVFYSGPRTARGGGTFVIIKFRTMYERLESYAGPRVTGQSDVRVTPVGRWLRDTKLNELPQLWNVLKGEMSLVGPRPEDPHIAAGWSADIRSEVLSVRPGITSPASVLYRDEENLLQIGRVMETYLADILPSKLRLDQLYVRQRSFWSDLDVLFWTMLVLLPQVKSYKPPEKHLFLGPFARLMKRYANWFVIDLVITLTALGGASLFWRTVGPLNLGWSVAVGLAVGFAVLFSLTSAVFGVYRVDWSHASATDAFDLLPGVGLATTIALVFVHYYPHGMIILLYSELPSRITRPLLPVGMILIATALALGGFVIARYRVRLITGLATRWMVWRKAAPAALERVLIIGGGETGQFAAWILSTGSYTDKFRLMGFVDDDLHKQDIRIRGIKVIGRRADIPNLVVRHDVGIIIFAIHNIAASERQQVLEICASTSAQVVIFPNIPAALGHFARNGTAFRTPSVHPAKAPDKMGAVMGQLPCHLCLTTVSPLEVTGWLTHLDKMAGSGNLASLRAEIQACLIWYNRMPPSNEKLIGLETRNDRK